MSMNSELQKHYAQLLGVGSPWEVKNVELKLAVMGAYSATAPYDCPKSKLILPGQ